MRAGSPRPPEAIRTCSRESRASPGPSPSAPTGCCKACPRSPSAGSRPGGSCSRPSRSSVRGCIETGSGCAQRLRSSSSSLPCRSRSPPPWCSTARCSAPAPRCSWSTRSSPPAGWPGQPPGQRRREGIRKPSCPPCSARPSGSPPSRRGCARRVRRPRPTTAPRSPRCPRGRRCSRAARSRWSSTATARGSCSPGPCRRPGRPPWPIGTGCAGRWSAPSATRAT